MKTKITAILLFVISFLSNVMAQNAWKPDPTNKYYVPETTPQYLTRVETLFGAEFEYSDEGGKVINILPNSPAENYNFKRGDIVTAIGSVVINSESAYRQAMEINKPDELVTVTFIRKGAEKERKVRLDKITVYKKAGTL